MKKTFLKRKIVPKVRNTAPKSKQATTGQNKPHRGKSKSLSKLKKELDSTFSRYIRAKYPSKCYTCGIRKTRKKLQCGHFISRLYLATRWEEDNCRPQCAGCNLFGAGKPLDFEENLVQELGEERVKEMKASRKQILVLKREWYEEQIAIFAEKLKKYDKN